MPSCSTQARRTDRQYMLADAGEGAGWAPVGGREDMSGRASPPNGRKHPQRAAAAAAGAPKPPEQQEEDGEWRSRKDRGGGRHGGAPRRKLPKPLEEALARPCKECRRNKVRCTPGMPCVRCYDRSLLCDKGLQVGDWDQRALAFASTELASIGQAYVGGFLDVCAREQCARPQALRLLRMWADVARRVAVDVTLGALDAVARHFDIAPEELVLTGTAPVLDGLPMLSGLDPLLRRGLELQTLYPFQTADGVKTGVAMWALGEYEAALAVNEDFGSFMGCAAQISAWSTEYGALPIHLFAALLAPGDREGFMQALASVSFAPPPHAATLFVKGMERSGQVSLWIVTLRSLTLEDSRLALLLRVEKAPKSNHLEHGRVIDIHASNRYRVMRSFLASHSPMNAWADAADGDEQGAGRGRGGAVVVDPGIIPLDAAPRTGMVVGKIAPIPPIALSTAVALQGERLRLQNAGAPRRQQQRRQPSPVVLSVEEKREVNERTQQQEAPPPPPPPSGPRSLYEMHAAQQQYQQLPPPSWQPPPPHQQQLPEALSSPRPMGPYPQQPQPAIALMMDTWEDRRSDASATMWGLPSPAVIDLAVDIADQVFNEEGGACSAFPSSATT